MEVKNIVVNSLTPCNVCVLHPPLPASGYPFHFSNSRWVESILYCYPSQVVTWKWNLLNLHQMAWELMCCLDSELQYQASPTVN